MGQFRDNRSRQWHRRFDVPRVIEGERCICAVVMCPKLDWPVDLFVQNKDAVTSPLEKPKTDVSLRLRVSAMSQLRCQASCQRGLGSARILISHCGMSQQTRGDPACSSSPTKT